MNHDPIIDRFLHAAYFAKTEPGRGPGWGLAPFLTISREAGAGGHAVAEAVLERLALRGKKDWLLFDRALLWHLSRDPRLKENLDSVMREDYYGKGHDFIRQVLGGKPPQDIVLARVFHILRTLAGLGEVVIIGRAGVCMTRDLPGGIHIRLVAGRAARRQTLIRLLLLDASQADAKLDSLDASRGELARRHFGQDLADPRLYDSVWNTDHVSVGDIADWVVERVEKKVRLFQSSQRAASSA